MPHIPDTSFDEYSARSGDCRTSWGVHQDHQPGSKTRTALAWREHSYREWLRHTAQAGWPYDRLARDDACPLSNTTAATGGDQYVPGACRYPLVPCPSCASRSLLSHAPGEK